ncbi:MAG: Ig-like domain-containing protein [Lachnospiraceae bacterium]|nr:Ig-like domain-containing protein [Lachnospiraceae bacterium]
MSLFEYEKKRKRFSFKSLSAVVLCAGMLLTSVDVTAVAAEVRDIAKEASAQYALQNAGYAHITPDITPDMDYAFGARAISDRVFRVEAGETVEMQVYAWSDYGNLQYTWYAPDGEELEASGEKLVIENISSSAFGKYRCMVSDVEGNSTKVVFSVTENTRLRVQAVDSTPVAYAGDEISLGVKATDYGNKDARFTYQWYKGSKIIEGATEAEYTCVNTSTKTKYVKYRCVVSNGSEETSYKFSVRLGGVKYLSVCPTEYKYCKEGTEITLTAKVISDHDPEKLTYQWYKGGVAIEGATEAEYTCVPFDSANEKSSESESSTIEDNTSTVTPPSSGVDNGSAHAISYTCQISDDYAQNTYQCSVRKIATDVDAGNGNSAGVMIGQGVNLVQNVRIAEGVSPDSIQYQWYKVSEDGNEETKIEGATDKRLIFESITEADLGQYKMKISWGESESVEVTYVLYKKTYAIEQSAYKAYEGMNVTYSVSSGSEDMSRVTYQWYQQQGVSCEKKPIAGANGKNFTTAYSAETKNTFYSCIFTKDNVTYEAGTSSLLTEIDENGTDWGVSNVYSGMTGMKYVYYNKKETNILLDSQLVKGNAANLTIHWEKMNNTYTWESVEGSSPSYEVDVDELEQYYPNQYRIIITDENGNTRTLRFALNQLDTLTVGVRDETASIYNIFDGMGAVSNPSIGFILNNIFYAPVGTVVELKCEAHTTLEDISYQWERYDMYGSGDWIEIEGANTAECTVQTNSWMDFGQYRCYITDGNEEYFYDAYLYQDSIFTVGDWSGNVINIKPGEKNFSLTVGEQATYSGEKNFSYEWFKTVSEDDNSVVPVEESENIQGVDTNTLTFTEITPNDYGSYTCKVTTDNLISQYYMQISWDGVYWKCNYKTNTSIYLYGKEGDTFDLQVEADDIEEPISYQWGYWVDTDNGYVFEPIDGATEAVYTAILSSESRSSEYICRATLNGYTKELRCSLGMQSEADTFKVLAKKQYNKDVNKRLAIGESITMGVAVYSKQDKLYYQWEVCTNADTWEFKPIEGATEAEYTLTIESEKDYASYRCLVSETIDGVQEYVGYHIFPARAETVIPTPPAEEDNQPESKPIVQPEVQTVAVTGVTLNKTSLDIEIGKDETLTAAVAPANATNQNITWSSSNPKVASVENGVVTANAKGTAIITVTTADGAKTASCTVNVLIPAEKVMIAKSKSIVKGDKYKLKATILPADSTDTITWTSSNEKVATVAADGTVKAIAAGTAKITAKTDSGKKTTCTIYVVRKKIKASKVSLNREKATIKSGAVLQLKATVSPKKSTDGLKWTSSNKKIAEVDANGVVTTKRSGKVKITVKTDSGKKAVCKLTITQDAESVQLNKTKLTLKVKDTFVLKAKMEPKDATDKLKWKSSNKKIVSVDKKGKIKALKKGKAVITVKTSSGKTATCKVTVK